MKKNLYPVEQGRDTDGLITCKKIDRKSAFSTNVNDAMFSLAKAMNDNNSIVSSPQDPMKNHVVFPLVPF